tara:strand:+ start:193 stop:558 length:366 start_codon:yes stop_codon:yes gene_type:complete
MDRCVYCGSSESIQNDHLIPYSFTYLKTRHRLTKSKKGTVPACGKCNRMLGSVMHTTIRSRAAFLLPKYNKLCSKFASLPEWPEEELSELGPTMRSTIESDIRQKEDLSLRRRHVELVANE